MEIPAGPSRKLPAVHLVKPKLEPGEESLPARLNAGEDQETTPLSGRRPFFTAIMAKTHVQKPYQLAIPAHFHRRLPARRTAAVLRCGGGSWIMSYCGDNRLKRLDGAWADFAVDNGLLVGDACVFELVSGGGVKGQELVFQVQVLRGGGMPGEIADKGATADDPIVIVD
ncbi:B3 domain-containing protein Os06g0112300-like [Lolium perenne]|uniref:B3 domain-containing protein Os06g0112300-like n=1 Tax=Lolium perenne TaxID=4522 RepID=UPI0021EA6125|nr:B3 domain-containing protein Os06g0112300-like [Lolium perenne]XP_051198037.1 B3 domain-containing protein Os06g0112300-like [Lolium perenne]XP_051198038.1 B3 domain-containing protein Os06g0112300-like [Lolium perenne]